MIGGGAADEGACSRNAGLLLVREGRRRGTMSTLTLESVAGEKHYRVFERGNLPSSSVGDYIIHEM